MSNSKKLQIQYPKKFVPMGSNDRILFLKENYSLKNLHQTTHWEMKVVAPINGEGFKVYIFPSNFNGRMEQEKPIFETKYHMSLNKVIALLENLEEEAKHDQLYVNPDIIKNKLSKTFFKKKVIVLRIKMNKAKK